MVHLHFKFLIKHFCLSRQKAEIFSICLIQDFAKSCKISAHLDKCSDDIFLQRNFVWFHKRKIKEMLKILDFYLDKQKSFFPKTNIKCNMYHGELFFSKQMAPWCPNFPHQRLCFLLPPSFLATKNSIFEPNVKQNTYSRLLFTIMIFSGTFFLIGHRILERELT